MSKIEIKTTQNILLFFSPASLGERIGAYLIDFLIVAGYSYIAYAIADELIPRSDSWTDRAIISLLLIPSSLYFLLCESLMQGQTVGKRLLKIRVVKIDGYQASFVDFLIRWAFGLVEVALFFGSIAFISAIASKYSQRLGDFAAGTAVITERNKMNISHTILEELEYNTYQPLFTQAEILLFSDSDVQTIKNFLSESLKSKSNRILERLSHKVTEISHREKESHTNDKDFIQQFLKDYNYYTGI